MGATFALPPDDWLSGFLVEAWDFGGFTSFPLAGCVLASSPPSVLIEDPLNAKRGVPIHPEDRTLRGRPVLCWLARSRRTPKPGG
jgi:hypothetical protein